MTRGPRAVAAAGALAAVLAAASACRRPEPPPAAAPHAVPAAAVPVGWNEVRAVAVAGDTVWLATTAGVAALDARTGAARRWAGDERTSHAGATDVSVSGDGTAWSAHGASPDAAPGPRRGGVRSFAGESVRAWFAEDGLGTDDIASIAVGDGFVVAAAGAVVAKLVPATPDARFERLFEEPARRLEVVDLASGGARRRVVEFRPATEAMTAVAVDGARIVAGSTHGLYVVDGGRLERHDMPCRVLGRAPERTVALDAWPGGFVAALALEGEDGAWRGAGLLEVRDAGLAHRCHAPEVDVPGASTLDVDADGEWIFAATAEGVMRIRGMEAELVERGEGVPAEPPTAVVGDGRGGCWVGTWGGGVYHLAGADVRTYWIGGDDTMGAASSAPAK